MLKPNKSVRNLLKCGALSAVVGECHDKVMAKVWPRLWAPFQDQNRQLRSPIVNYIFDNKENLSEHN